MLLSDSINNLKGIGDKTSALFKRVGVFSLWDLLMYIPRDFETLPELTTVDKLEERTYAAVLLTIKTAPQIIRAGRLNILSVMAADNEGRGIKLTWFNSPFMKKMLKPGMTRVFYGRVGMKQVISLEMPRIFTEEDYNSLKGVLQPVYPLTKGLTSKSVGKAVEQVLKDAEIDDFLSDKELKELKLMELRTAIYSLHRPKDKAQMAGAYKRISFNEFLIFMLNIKKLKDERGKNINHHPLMETAAAKRVMESLPFTLTSGQKKAYQDIISDISSEKTMNRLLQGDVGSGKTIIAFLAMITAADKGCQAALMAPTEVLASQHAEKLKSLLKKAGLDIKVVLLTGALSAKEKKEARREIAEGEAQLIVGTHALIQEGVEFKDLALAVTDEQHRFGVKQREKLSGAAGKDAHVLVMSATPIPRTLAIILYGDLDITVMDERPALRKPIKNCVVDEGYRNTAYSFIKKEIEAGHQAYVICPMVEESEASDYENVTDYSEKLRSIYGDKVRVGMLNGRMKSKEKTGIMERFASGDIDVLVSTTVVEVGVDVPNATVMMIENAERFGLASLHQIRGRVGRGDTQGYCIFIDTSGDEKENKRLKILNDSNDGFEIADEDLKLRGPGDMFGVRQSGEMAFRIADIYRDADMLKKASDYAGKISDEVYRKLQGYMKYENRLVL